MNQRIIFQFCFVAEMIYISIQYERIIPPFRWYDIIDYSYSIPSEERYYILFFGILAINFSVIWQIIFRHFGFQFSGTLVKSRMARRPSICYTWNHGGINMSKTDEKQAEFWFTLVRSGDFRELWKPQLEILFLLKGKGRIHFANTKTTYTVREEDIFVINSFEIHNLELNRAHFISASKIWKPEPTK